MTMKIFLSRPSKRRLNTNATEPSETRRPSSVVAVNYVTMPMPPRHNRPFAPKLIKHGLKHHASQTNGMRRTALIIRPELTCSFSFTFIPSSDNLIIQSALNLKIKKKSRETNQLADRFC